MNTLGLIGYPLSHSFSPSYFAEKFKLLGITDWEYQLFPIDNIHLLPPLIQETTNLKGLNVTIPYKEKVLSYCTSLSKEAETIGAVNFLQINDSEIIGHNTDWIGFTNSLKNWYQPSLKKALILGNGGASKAIIYGLNALNIDYDIVARNNPKNNSFLKYTNISETLFTSYDLIINCTPVGTHGHSENLLPLPYEAIQNYHFFYDLVYNPSLTEIAKLFKTAGASIKNGWEMLQIQADETWKIVKP